MTVEPPFAEPDPQLDEAMTMHERLQVLAEPAPSLGGTPDLPDMVTGRFITVDIETLRDDPSNPRPRLAGIEGLADSIRTMGLKQTILVRRRGRYLYLAEGHRRRAALQLLVSRGYTQWRYVWAQLEDPRYSDDLDALRTMLGANWHREDIDPISQAQAVRKLMQGKKIATYEEAAELIGGVSPVTLRGRCQLLDHLSTAEQEEVRGGILTLGEAHRRITERRHEEHGGPLRQSRSRPAGRPSGRSGPPIDDWYGPQHVLANQARAFCRRGGHKPRAGRGPHGIACLQCWEAVIRRDQTMLDAEKAASGTSYRERMDAARQAKIDEAAAVLGVGATKTAAKTKGKRVEQRVNAAIERLDG